jgi:hypothetical protein
VRALHAAELSDHYSLLIHPLTLSSGRQLFEGAAPLAEFEVTDSTDTNEGAIIARYTPAPQGDR